MTIPQQQFTESAQRGQEALTAAVQAWTENVTSFLGAVPGRPGELPNAAAVVDSVFDFAEKQLASQRELAKNLLATVPSTTGTRKTAK